MKAEELIDTEDYDIIEFEKYHWIFYQREDHIDVYETRDGDVIGGFYAPDAPFTLQDIIEKTSYLDEEGVYEFIETYIEWY